MSKTTFGMNQKLLLASAAVMLFVGGIALGFGLREDSVPSEDSAEVGFARDMSLHHSQAVEMATLLYDRTEDDDLRFLAYDILTTQQAQIGMMRGWLDIWQHWPNGSEPAMTWMGMPTEGMMPGMATSDEIDQLRDASGREADVLFMQLMIPHHESGVTMANAALVFAEAPAVKGLALKMAQAQAYEIEYMQTWLRENGYDAAAPGN